MSVAPMMTNPPAATPEVRRASSREDGERQAWSSSESTSDRAQLLPEVEAPSKAEIVAMKGVIDVETPPKTASGEGKLVTSSTHGGSVVETEIRKMDSKPNGVVVGIVNKDGGLTKDALRVEPGRRGSHSCPNLTGDLNFVPRPTLKEGLSQETLRMDDLASESEYSQPQPTTSSKGFWTSIKAVNRLKSSVKKKERKRTKKISVQRVDSFLEKFTTRRGDLMTHTEEEDNETEIAQDEVEEEEEKFKTIVLPDGDILFYWLFVVTFAIVYNFWVLIAREAWPELQEKGKIAWFVFDYLCDFIYILDIVVQMRTAYLENGLLVMDGRKLARHYVRSWHFIVDLLSLLPTDLFYLMDPDRWHPMVRFPRFLRVYRYQFWSKKLETRTQFPNTFRVVNLTHLLLLLLHWAGAAYFLICEAIGFGSEGSEDEWVYAIPVGKNASLPHKYLASFYWSTLTLTTIGDLPTPHLEIEYFVQIVGYLVGIFIFATVVGQVGAVIENRNATRMEFERHVDHAKRYMRTNNVPREVQLRMLRWYDYTWKRGATQGRGDVNSLGLLPDKHRTELALHVNLQTLKRVSILQVCPPEFLHDLVLKMHLCIFTPGDLVCRKGEVAREMYIISEGLLDVIDEGGRVVATLKTGDYFGEIGILDLEGTSNRRMADVQSVGFSELFSLSKDDVLGVLKDYPQVKSVIEEEARRRLMMQQMQKEEAPDDAGPDGPGDVTEAGKPAEKEIDRDSVISNFSMLHVQREGAKPSIIKKEPLHRSYATNTIGSRSRPASSSSSSHLHAQQDAVVKDIIGSMEKILADKFRHLAEETRQPQNSSKEMQEKVKTLQRENESKSAKIQTLERRIMELEKSLLEAKKVTNKKT